MNKILTSIIIIPVFIFQTALPNYALRPKALSCSDKTDTIAASVGKSIAQTAELIGSEENLNLTDKELAQLKGTFTTQAQLMTIKRMIEHIDRNVRIDRRSAIPELKSFLLDPKVKKIFTNKDSPWVDKKDKILTIFENMLSNIVIPRGRSSFELTEAFIHRLKIFFIDRNINKALTAKDSPLKDKKDEILSMLENLFSNVGLWIDLIISELERESILQIVRDKQALKKEIQDIMATLLSDEKGEKFSQLIPPKSTTRNDIHLSFSTMLPFFKLGILFTLFPEERKNLKDILQKLVSDRKKGKNIDILTHLLCIGLFLPNIPPLVEKPTTTDLSLETEYPVIEESDLNKLPVITLSSISNKSPKAHKRNIRMMAKNHGYNLKLMFSNEEVTPFNAEAWIYTKLGKPYPGIIPEPLTFNEKLKDKGIYLIRIKKDQLDKLLDRKIEKKLHKTEDGYYIGFVYKAKIGYFDYCIDNLTEDEAIACFKNLSMLIKEYSILHREVLPIFHDFNDSRRYRMASGPLGCIDNPDEHFADANLRKEGTIADLSPYHLRKPMPYYVWEQLFQVIMFVSHRLEKNHIKTERLAFVLQKGINEYIKTLYPDLYEQELEDLLDRINYNAYAEDILGGFKNKTKGIDLGENNGPLSIHCVADLAGFTSLCVYYAACMRSPLSAPAKEVFSAGRKALSKLPASGSLGEGKLGNSHKSKDLIQAAA